MVAVSVIAVALKLYLGPDHAQITDACRRASEVRHGSQAAEAAVRELTLYEGERVTQLLLKIALGETDFSNERIKAEAVRALKEGQH